MAFFTGKFRTYKRTQYLEREFYTDDACAETEDVAVVVLARLMRRIRIAAKRRANAAQLVRRDRRAYTTPTDQHADLRRTVLHGFANQFCVIRIIVRNRAVVSAEVNHFMAGASQFLDRKS